ncbi:MAG: ThiF family adenylyltransferase [Bacillota bacterium]|nr:ThiF family adenylyltransferase [Bacillota bacterium]
MSCLLIGKKLINDIKGSSLEYEYINGFGFDGVFGVWSVEVGEDKPVLSIASSEIIFDHRHFWNNYKEKILIWCKVDTKIISKIIKDVIINQSELESYLPSAINTLIDKDNDHVLLVSKEEGSKLVAFVRFIKNLVVICDLQKLDEKTNPYKRIDGLVPLEELKEKKVAIVGLGSGGSIIALELAAAGIGELYLVDKDRLELVNIFRHICDKRDIGRKKVDAVKSKIQDSSFPVKVYKFSKDVIYNPYEFREFIKDTDLVICATDTPDSRSLTNYVCNTLNKNLILVCAFDNARIGEIIRVVPEKTACYECSRIYLSDLGAMVKGSDDPDVIPYGPQSQDKANESRGARTDVVILGAIAARIGLMTLTQGYSINFGEIDYSYLTWGSVKNNSYPPPFKFNNPFSMNYSNLKIHPSCPICGDLPEELNGIDIEEKYSEIMQKIAE